MSECLEVDSVIKSFGEHDILTDIYLCCRPKDIIGIFGINGSGKSTLLKIIFGTMKANRSFVRINGVVQNCPAYLSGMIAYLPQDSFLPQHITMYKLVQVFLGYDKVAVNHFLGDRFLFKLRNEKIRDLSGGEQRYLEIKLIINSRSPYILLDEPFNGLSPISAGAIRQYIVEASQKKGIVLVDHNYREVEKVVNRIFLLDRCYLREFSYIEELAKYGYFQTTAFE